MIKLLYILFQGIMPENNIKYDRTRPCPVNQPRSDFQFIESPGWPEGASAGGSCKYE